MSLRQRKTNPHWREAQRPEDAPALWQRVTHAAQSCSVLRALAALQAASPAEVEEAQRCASLGLITPAIRAAIRTRGFTAPSGVGTTIANLPTPATFAGTAFIKTDDG